MDKIDQREYLPGLEPSRYQVLPGRYQVGPGTRYQPRAPVHQMAGSTGLTPAPVHQETR